MNQSRHSVKTTITIVLTLIACLAVIISLETGSGKTTDQSDLAPPSPLKVRLPVAAGSFYPADPETLYDEVAKMLGSTPTIPLSNVRAILVPHAGYIFSGGIAAESFREVPKDFKTVVILAANHNGQTDFSGVSLPPYAHYAIPGAKIPLSDLNGELLKDPLFTSLPEAHSKHMIEIELPFLQQIKGNPVNPDYTILPMILGRMDSTAIARLAKRLSDLVAPGVLFIFSIDLSHYYPESQAKKLDSYAIRSLLSGDSEALSRATTDGNHVMMTLVELARLQGWESTLLRYGHSGQANGDNNRVVGYAAIAFHPPFTLDEGERKALLTLARKTIASHLQTGKDPRVDEKLLNRFPRLKTPRAAFVTLKKNGVLRGCIGNLTSNAPLYSEVQNCAISAATRDRRFPPVSATELDSIDLSISILGQPSRIIVSNPNEYARAVRPGKDGIILLHKGRSSTFLPTVWNEIPDAVDFLSQLCLKQGSPPGCWNHEETTMYRYEAFDFSERR